MTREPIGTPIPDMFEPVDRLEPGIAYLLEWRAQGIRLEDEDPDEAAEAARLQTDLSVSLLCLQRACPGYAATRSRADVLLFEPADPAAPWFQLRLLGDGRLDVEVWENRGDARMLLARRRGIGLGAAQFLIVALVPDAPAP